MKALTLALITVGFVGFAGIAQAGPDCGGMKQDKTAEIPPPPPPPAPSS